jgi:hypothetical protein
MSRLRSPGDDGTLTGMVPTVDVAARLWEHLEGLSRGLDPRQLTIPTVRVTVDSGAMLEVFRADPVEAAMAAWRVRGFTGGTAVRLAVILGTRDGRAMVTERVSDESEEAVVGGLVVSAEPGQRALVDLSEAIARAVRALMGDPPA